jgi:nucleotide-binding universal stress UspA family protein
MLNLTKILFPVDFFEGSETAALHAAALARHFHAELTLVHVQALLNYRLASIESGFPLMPEELYPEAANQARSMLDSFLSDKLADIKVRRVFLEGDPAERIVTFAHSDKTSLIVMPTHGYGLFRRFLLGSVTAKVLHDAECPVWTGVHLKETVPKELLPIRSVLCSIDLGPHSRTTLCWAAQMAAEFGARLTLAHATEPLEMTARAGSYFAPEWRRVLYEQASQEVDKLQGSLGSKAEVWIESGEVTDVMRAAAADVKADLLVIGRSPSHGLTGRLHANAYALIRESPCPVVSV